MRAGKPTPTIRKNADSEKEFLPIVPPPHVKNQRVWQRKRKERLRKLRRLRSERQDRQRKHGNEPKGPRRERAIGRSGRLRKPRRGRSSRRPWRPSSRTVSLQLGTLQKAQTPLQAFVGTLI